MINEREVVLNISDKVEVIINNKHNSNVISTGKLYRLPHY